MTSVDPTAQHNVRDFWDETPCGEVYFVGDTPAERSEAITTARYELEPFIADFADFDAGHNRDVLEIGVGIGTDHCQWARAKPSSLSGIDLSERSIELAASQLKANALTSTLKVADARKLPFPDDSFDIVYSWGVLHHSTEAAAIMAEVWRVLRPGGVAKIMVYNKHSIAGAMLWLRYGLLAGKPRRSLNDIYSQHLESPGTQAFTTAQALSMLSQFAHVSTRIELSPGDLLTGEAGQRHDGPVLRSARRLWPRPLLRKFAADHGLYLLISAEK